MVTTEDFTMFDDNNEFDTISFEDYNGLDYALLKLESLKRKVANSKLIGRKDLEGLEMFFPNVLSLEDFTIEPTESNLQLMQSFESVGVIALIVGAIIAAITAIITFVLGRNTKSSEDFDKNQETAAVSAAEVINISQSPPIVSTPPPQSAHQNAVHSSNNANETPAAIVVPVNDITPDSTPKEVIMSMAANTRNMDEIAKRSNFLIDKIGINNEVKRNLILFPDRFNIFYEFSNTINYEMIKKISSDLKRVNGILQPAFSFKEEYKGENDIKTVSKLVSDLNKAVEPEVNKVKSAYKLETDIEKMDDSWGSMDLFKNAINTFIMYYRRDSDKDKFSNLSWERLLELTKEKKYGYYRSIKRNAHILYFIKNKRSITKEFEALKKVAEEIFAVEKEYGKGIILTAEQRELMKIAGEYRELVLDYIQIYKNYYTFVIDTANMMDDLVQRVHKSCEQLISYRHQMTKRASTESYKTPPSFKW